MNHAGTFNGASLFEALRVALGLRPMPWVLAATTMALPANTRTGNVLAADAVGAFPAIDTIALSVGDSFLANHEATSAHDGPYRLVAAGGASSRWSIRRVDWWNSDADAAAGSTVFVMRGQDHGGRVFIQKAPAPITLNVTALSWEKLVAPFLQASPEYLELETPADGQFLRRSGSYVLGTDGGDAAFHVENRTDDPAAPASGRLWLRTDL